MIKVSIDRKVMQNVMSGVADQLKNKIDLNLNHVKKLCKERYGIETIVGVENRDAKIVVFKDQIACRLDFEVRFPMSILITSKENSNSTLPENDDMRAELDDLMAKELYDKPEELDDIPEELDDIMADELDDIPEELDDMRAALDDLMAEEQDDKPEVIEDIQAELDMSELKEESLTDKDDKNPKISS